VLYVQAATLAKPPAGDQRARFERKTMELYPPCTTVGVCKRIDLESLSDDIARLIAQLGEEAEGRVEGDDLRKIESKIEKIVKG
jgi:hypothetical protein